MVRVSVRMKVRIGIKVRSLVRIRIQKVKKWKQPLKRDGYNHWSQA